MAMGKLAKIATITTAIGAITVTGVVYHSNKDQIENYMASLKNKALAWKSIAGQNKEKLEGLQGKYNSIVAYLNTLLPEDGKLQDGATVEQIQEAINSIKQDAEQSGSTEKDETWKENYNAVLKQLADYLGITIEKGEDGLYPTQPIYDELKDLSTALENLEKALGDLGVDGKEGNAEGSLTDKINYLINQINLANKDQNELLTTAQQYDSLVSEASEDYVSTLKYAVTFIKGNPIKASGNADISDSFKSTLNTQTANTVKILNDAGILGATEGMEVTVQPYFRTTDDNTGVADTTNKYRMLVSDDGYHALYAYAQEHPENEKLKIVNGELLMYTTTTMTDADRKGQESAHGDDMYENCWNTNYKPVVSNSMVGR